MRDRLSEASNFTQSIATRFHANTLLLFGDGQRSDVQFDWNRGTTYPDPRLAIPVEGPAPDLPELPPERASLWLAVATVAMLLLVAAAILRVAWLYRVEKGKVKEFSVRAMVADTSEAVEGADAPVFTLVPFHKRVRLLVHADARGEEVVARVLG